MAVKVRYAKKEDINQVWELGNHTAELVFSKKYPFHSKIELFEFLNPRENIFLVASLDNKVIGFLFAKIMGHTSGGWCMLDNIAVNRKYRAHGVGTLMLKELYKNMKKRKLNYVQILEDIHHKNTRKFWKDKGFKETHAFVWAEKSIR